jgi:hypothetical protein
VTGRRRRRIKVLLNNLKEKRGYSSLKEEALIAPYGELTFEEVMDLL